LPHGPWNICNHLIHWQGERRQCSVIQISVWGPSYMHCYLSHKQPVCQSLQCHGYHIRPSNFFSITERAEKFRGLFGSWFYKIQHNPEMILQQKSIRLSIYLNFQAISTVFQVIGAIFARLKSVTFDWNIAIYHRVSGSVCEASRTDVDQAPHLQNNEKNVRFLVISERSLVVKCFEASLSFLPLMAKWSPLPTADSQGLLWRDSDPKVHYRRLWIYKEQNFQSDRIGSDVWCPKHCTYRPC